MIMLARPASRHASRNGAAVGLIVSLGLALGAPAAAQQLTLPADPLGAGDTPLISRGDSTTIDGGATVIATDVGAAPSVQQTSGTLYNPLTGSHIRAQYNTESYGQAEGNLNLGTMLLRRIDGGVGFFDGQVTMNDESRVGYNLGVGYRWLTLPVLPYSPDDRKIMGVSLWADGQSVDGESFFPQIGTSLELLGDRLDFRANGYAVLGDRTQSRDFVGTGVNVFDGNVIAERTIGVLDTALTVAEMELASRIYNQEAWLFTGIYGYRGGEFDGTGGKIGIRGYLTPDLNLSVAITHDDEFDTNGVMRLTWFIGRTRRENCPCGTLEDRFREPVIRNDYIAIGESRTFGVQGTVLDANGDPVRVVHVDSTAGAGGDGTFENPLNMLSDIAANSMEGDTVLVHGGSMFTGDGAVLQDTQRLLGEGGGITNTVATADGALDLPETAAGAMAGPIPTINDSPVAGVILADDNTVNNLAFDGGVSAIRSDATEGSANPTLTNLTIANTMPIATEGAINLINVARADDDDFDGDGDTTETVTTLGTVTIDDVVFSGVAGEDINIDADVVAADNVLAETINISDVTSTGNTNGVSLDVRNTNGVGVSSIAISDYDSTGAGLRLDSNESIATLSNITVDGAMTSVGIDIQSAAAAVSIDSANISNTGEEGIRVTSNTAPVTIGAAGDDGEVSITNVTGPGAAILIDSNNGVAPATGTVTIQNVAIDGTTTANGIEIRSNTADVNIGAAIANGEVTIENVAGDAVLINGADAAVTFDNGSTITGGGNGVVVEDTLEDGDVSIGTTASITDVSGRALTVARNAGTVTADADMTNAVTGGGVQITSNEAVVTVNGAVTSFDASAIDINDSQASITFSGDITTDGTAAVDAISITDAGTNTADTAQVSIDGSVTNNADGDVVAIAGGDDNILFGTVGTASTITGNATGISISGRLSGADVTFNSATTLNNAGSLRMGTSVTGGLFNADDSAVTFTSLDITNNATSGSAIVGNMLGELNINTGTINATMGASAIDLTDGSSTTGLLFTEVNVSGGADRAVSLVDFDGTVTIPEGSFVTDSLAVNVEDSGLVLNSVSIDSASNQAIVATYSENTANGLSVNGDDGGTNESFNGGSLVFSTTATGGAPFSVQNVDDLGAVSFDSNGSNNSTLQLSNVTTNDGFDYDVDGDGNLAVTHNNVTGDGDTTLDVTDGGNGSLIATGFDTGGTLVATSTAASDGDLTVDITNGGNTTAFTGITVNDQGDGAVLADFNNVDSTSGVDFDADGDGNATLEVNGGSYGGEINGMAQNTGTFTATINGSPTLSAGGVVLDAQNDGAFTATVDGVDASASGALSVTAANTTGNADVTVTGGSYNGDATITGAAAVDGEFNVTVNGSTTIDGATGLTITAANDNNFTANVSGVDAANGDFTVVANNTTGNASVTLNDSDFGGDIDIDSAAAGTFTVAMTGPVTADGAGGVDISATNGGDFTTTITNITASAGGFNVAANNTAGNADVSVTTGDFAGPISVTGSNPGDFDVALSNVDSDSTLSIVSAASMDNSTVSVTDGNFLETSLVFANTGTLNLTVDSNTIDTGANNTVGLGISVGGGVTGGELIVQNNSVMTGDNIALDFDISVGDFDLALITNNLTNNSTNSQNTLIDVSGGGTSLDATIFTNTFANSEAGATEGEFELATTAGSPTINLNLAGNTATRGAGTGEFVLREDAGNFTIFERDDTIGNVGNRNDGTITALPAPGDFVESVGEPNNPAANP